MVLSNLNPKKLKFRKTLIASARTWKSSPGQSRPDLPVSPADVAAVLPRRKHGAQTSGGSTEVSQGS